MTTNTNTDEARMHALADEAKAIVIRHTHADDGTDALVADLKSTFDARGGVDHQELGGHCWVYIIPVGPRLFIGAHWDGTTAFRPDFDTTAEKLLDDLWDHNDCGECEESLWDNPFDRE